VKHQDFLAPFDYENCPSSSLEKGVRNVVEEISNLTMYRDAVS
jgi:hypothetical protein